MYNKGDLFFTLLSVWLMAQAEHTGSGVSCRDTRGSDTCWWVIMIGVSFFPALCCWLLGSSCLQTLCPAQHSFLAQHPSGRSTLGPPSYRHHIEVSGWVLHPLLEQRRAESIRFHKGYSHLSQNAFLSYSNVFSEINMFYLFI